MLKNNEIKQMAYSIGFSACGITQATPVEKEIIEKYKEWLSAGNHGEMKYLANNLNKRLNPQELVENAKTIIVVLLNYYPPQKQPQNIPQVAKCAYGRDYHKVVKKKLKLFYQKLQEMYPSLKGRYFCDSAPVLERIWALKSGLGWIGKNNLLINKKLGSFFFIGELIINIPADEYDKPIKSSHCGTCTKCIDACPTGALYPYKLNANLCISYDTIELKDPSKSLIPSTHNWLFGCDICQDVCPWNQKLIPTTEEDLFIKPFLLQANKNDWEKLTEQEFQSIFHNSQLKRAGLIHIKQTLKKL